MEIIDSLFVVLGLDPSGFKKATKEVHDDLKKTGDKAEKAQKDIEAANKKVEESYRKIRNSILEITAAIVGAVAGRDFVKYLTENDNAATKLATNVGSTTQEVLTLQTAFKRIGASGDEAGGALRGITKILEDLKNTGASEALYPLQRAGLDVAAFRNAGSNLERMAMMAKTLAKLSPQDAQYWGQKSGFSEETITLMKRYGDQLSKMFEESSKYNRITEADTEASRARADAYAKLEGRFETMGRKITTFLTPAIDWLMDAFSSLFDMLSQSAPAAIATISTLAGAILLLKGYSISTFAAQFTGNIATMGVAVGGLLGKLGLLGLALGGGVGVGMGLDWLIAKGLTAATGKETDLGGWIYDLFDKNDYTGAGGAQGGGSRQAGGSSGPDVAAKQAFLRQLEGQYGLPAGLLDSVWRQESGRGKNMLSPKGAKGDFGFKDATAAQYGVDVTDFKSSARGSARMYADLLRQYGGNLPMALAGYNWGFGNLQHGGMGHLPAETSGYIRSIVAGMNSPGAGGGGSGSTVNVGPVTITTSASTMTGAGQDFGKGLNRRLLIAGQSNGNLD